MYTELLVIDMQCNLCIFMWWQQWYILYWLIFLWTAEDYSSRQLGFFWSFQSISRWACLSSDALHWHIQYCGNNPHRPRLLLLLFCMVQGEKKSVAVCVGVLGAGSITWYLIELWQVVGKVMGLFGAYTPLCTGREVMDNLHGAANFFLR